MIVEIHLTVESDSPFDLEQQFDIQSATNTLCSALEDLLSPNRDRFITYKMTVDGVKYDREY